MILVGGTIFLVDFGLEYYRFTYNKNGSDYVRMLMEHKKGKGFNDEQIECQVTEQDVEELQEFMKPIEQHYRMKDIKREDLLNRLREQARIN